MRGSSGPGMKAGNRAVEMLTFCAFAPFAAAGAVLALSEAFVAGAEAGVAEGAAAGTAFDLF